MTRPTSTPPAPPNSVEAEEALLGACQIDPAAYKVTRGIVQARDFYIQKNAFVWEAMGTLVDQGKPIDFVLLCNELEQRGQLVEIGGPEYVSRLEAIVPSALYARDYALDVANLAVRRRTIHDASELVRVAHSSDGAFDADRARVLARMAHDGAQKSVTTSARQAMDGFSKRLEYNYTHPLEPDEVRYLSTGIKDLDRLLGGLCVGCYVIGAVTHIGKTALSLAIAANIAEGIYKGKSKAAPDSKVMFFSKEMTPDQLIERLVCARARISSDAVDSGRVPDDKWPEIVSIQGQISEWPLYISKASSMQEITAEVYRNAPVALIVCDGIELITGTDKEQTHEARGEVTRWGLDLAQDDDVLAPIWIPMQVSAKTLKDRSDKRPTDGDLYGSSEPGMGADVVLTLHREDRWTMDKTATPDTHELEVFLWKHRLKKRGIPSKTVLRYGDFGEITDIARHSPLGFD